MSRGANTARSSSESLFYSVTSIAWVKGRAKATRGERSGGVNKARSSSVFREPIDGKNVFSVFFQTQKVFLVFLGQPVFFSAAGAFFSAAGALLLI